MKEDFFIEIIKTTLPESARYIGDDTAYVEEKDLVLTQDTLIEGVHFRQTTISAYYLGRKSIAVNLSDIAAAGGIPLYVLISLSMPSSIPENFVKDFYRGVNDICKEFGVFVVGGDLTKAFELTISVCAIGKANNLSPANRRNARNGDIVVVTGNHGSSRAGFEILENPDRFYNIKETTKEKFILAHINPFPQIKNGRKILEISKKPAMMDSSDGLGDALSKICKFSNVGMLIDFNKIPYDKSLNMLTNGQNELIKWVFFGGEDYELVATVSEPCFKKLLEQKIPVYPIGKVVCSKEQNFPVINIDNQCIKIDKKILDSELYNHFRGT